MIISNEQAEYLLNISKKIVINDVLIDKFILNQKFPISIRFDLVSDINSEYSFLWEITQSSKNILKLSLHFQENESKIGLFRIDYNSGHRNPENVNPNLPERFIPYAGKIFSPNENHVHYFVEGYKPLAWALPIECSQINTKKIDNISENFASAILDFAKIINLTTELSINSLLV